jgi:hypothetical protein
MLITQQRRARDVGCGGGAFLRVAWRWARTAVALNRASTALPRPAAGLDVFDGHLHECANGPLSRRRFDVITHPQPVELLRQMKGISVPGAWRLGPERSLAQPRRSVPPHAVHPSERQTCHCPRRPHGASDLHIQVARSGSRIVRNTMALQVSCPPNLAQTCAAEKACGGRSPHDGQRPRGWGHHRGGCAA